MVFYHYHIQLMLTLLRQPSISSSNTDMRTSGVSKCLLHFIMGTQSLKHVKIYYNMCVVNTGGTEHQILTCKRWASGGLEQRSAKYSGTITSYEYITYLDHMIPTNVYLMPIEKVTVTDFPQSGSTFIQRCNWMNIELPQLKLRNSFYLL